MKSIDRFIQVEERMWVVENEKEDENEKEKRGICKRYISRKYRGGKCNKTRRIV